MAQIDLKIIMDEATQEVLQNANDILKRQREISDDMAKLLLDEIERRVAEGWHDEWTAESVPDVLERYPYLRRRTYLMDKPIDIETLWENGHEVVVIEGVRYTADLFRIWAGTYTGDPLMLGIQEGKPFEIVGRESGVLCLRTHVCKGEDS